MCVVSTRIPEQTDGSSSGSRAGIWVDSDGRSTRIQRGTKRVETETGAADANKNKRRVRGEASGVPERT